jgi:hypothetical protein
MNRTSMALIILSCSTLAGCGRYGSVIENNTETSMLDVKLEGFGQVVHVGEIQSGGSYTIWTDVNGDGGWTLSFRSRQRSLSYDLGYFMSPTYQRCQYDMRAESMWWKCNGVG